jgi:hypothetical protein
VTTANRTGHSERNENASLNGQIVDVTTANRTGHSDRSAAGATSKGTRRAPKDG